MASDEIYYRHGGALPLAKRISFYARLRIYRLFLSLLQPSATDRILDVGVSAEMSAEANILERVFPHPENIVCASIDPDGTAILAQYPKVRFVPIRPNAPLPFANGEFAIAYSNAVIEHVGGAGQQKVFLQELARVARRVFVVSPNRLFPVELHTGLPLLHYLPKPWFRALLRRTPLAYWAHEANLNLLSPAEARRLGAAQGGFSLLYSGIPLGPLSSNWVLYKK
jgi:hypothetical protein